MEQKIRFRFNCLGFIFNLDERIMTIQRKEKQTINYYNIF